MEKKVTKETLTAVLRSLADEMSSDQWESWEKKTAGLARQLYDRKMSRGEYAFLIGAMAKGEAAFFNMEVSEYFEAIVGAMVGDWWREQSNDLPI